MLSRDACLVTALLATAFLAGCSDAALVEKYAPAKEVATARTYAEMLRQGKVEAIRRDLDPKLASSVKPGTLEELSGYIPNEEPRSVKTVNARVHRNDQVTDADVTFEYEFPAQWLIVTVSIEEKDGSTKIAGLRVMPLGDSLERLNRFALAGKTPVQYFTLLFVVSTLAFVLYTFVMCLRSNEMRPKWLWLVIILVGVGKFAVNWQTGNWECQLLSFQIPCILASRVPYGPWIIGAYLPVGAFAYYHRRWINRVEGKWIPESSKLTEPSDTHKTPSA